MIEIWLLNCKFDVEIDGLCYDIYKSNEGTIQVSVLGPILCAIFVSYLTEVTNFADDNFVIQFNKYINQLILDFEMKLEIIIKWLKDDGLKVNNTKTELCLFHSNDTIPIKITLQGVEITSKKTINSLGVTFDSKLNWAEQVLNAIKKSNKAFCALTIVKRYLPTTVIHTLLISVTPFCTVTLKFGCLTI
jgi:hypothetical protein